MSTALIKLIQEKAGIGEQQAAQAVDVVVDFLKDKLPEPIGAQLDTLVKAEIPGAGTQLDGLMSGLGGMLGNKE